MITVNFILKNGNTQTIDADAGSNVMQVATSNGVPGIEGACGGFCSCATCHVYVESNHALPPPKDDEDRMLDGTSAERRKNSRLACQIVLTDDMNGLTVRMPDSQ